MRIKKFKLQKRILSLILVLFLCIESFAAVVSDNDGSAFITKAEFDSLKNNFQSQIDQYNTSIDAKIDGAIAAYIAGITTKRTFEPDILLNKVDATRRSFKNNFANPTTNTQDDVRLEICKQLTLATVGLWQTMGQSIERANSSFYAISTLSGNHAKSRQPRNNGKNGKFLLVKPSSYGGYTVSDGYTYSIEQKVDISGGEIKEESYLDKPIFNYYQNTSHNFTSYSTDTIFTQNLNIAKVQTEAGGSVTNITVPAMVSICVLEAKSTKYDQFFTMSSGSVWTANTGCVPYNNLHTWTYTNSEVKLPNGSGEAQAYGGWFKWNSSSTASDKRVWTGRNVYTDYTTTRTWVPVSFKGPKIEMIAGSNLVVEDVSNLVDKKTYYYSGLPLFTLSETGKVTMDLGFAWNTKDETIVAIRDLPFDNTNITSKSSNDIFWKKYSTSDIPSSNRVTITLDAKDLKDKKGKTLYIKMKSNNSTSGAWVRPYLYSCKIEVE